MADKIYITKGSDEQPVMRMPKKVGRFWFSDSNLSDVKCELVDKDGNSIHEFTKLESTLVPVTVSYDDNDNMQLTADDDTDYFTVYLLGSYTTSSATGQVRAKYTIIWNNTNFADDSTKDKIIWDDTDYYLKANA